MSKTDTSIKISIRDVHKSFGHNHVLRGVDLDVCPGRSMVVIGGSGTGKSVLLKCILGLITPDSGSIIIDGQSVTNLSPAKRAKVMAKFGMLFQGGALFDSLSVWENVAFRLLYADGVARKSAKKRAEAALNQVNLGADVMALSPAELSGGMQKRVGLARAIVARPEIMFFDEPTTGLDPITADVIDNLIRRQVTALGATAVSITHDMNSVRKIADDVAMIYEGKIIWQGGVKEVDKSGNPYVEQFVTGSEDGPIKVLAR
ncbi:MAG: ABC transporter ATP-binding protein [Robiginitomaculum sp.]|nr:MAG: ABC transporter ATP-binding protein [Robiginitomaculum sp.]